MVAIAQRSGEGLPPDLRQRGEEAIQAFDRGNRTGGLQALIQVVIEGERSMGRNHPALTQVHNTISVFFQSERVFDRALLHADRALECAAGFGDPKHARLLQAKVSRAGALMNLGRLDDAEKIYSEVVKSFRETGDGIGECEALAGLGATLQEMGRFSEAERALLASLDLRISRKMPLEGVSKTLSALGNFYSKIGDYDRALHYQNQSIETGRKAWGEGHAFLFDRLIGAAKLLRYLKRYDEARALLIEVRKIAETTSGPGSPQLALLSGFEANLAADTGDFEKAFALESAAMKIEEDRFGKASRNRDISLNNLGFLAALRGDFARAEACFSEAFDLIEQGYGKDNAAAANCAINRSMLAALRGNAAGAVSWLNDGNARYEAVLQAVSGLAVDSQKLTFLQQLSGKTHYAVSLHQKMFPDDDGARRAALTTILSRKGRAADLTRRAQTNAAPDPKQQRRSQLLGEIAGLAIGKTQERPGVAKEKAWALQQELERLDRETGDVKGAAPEISKTSIEAVQKRLNAEEILVEYVMYQPTRPDVPKAKADTIPMHCAAYVLFADGTVKSAALGELGPIETAIRTLRAELIHPESERYREPARALDKLIVEPLRKMAGGKVRWRISPDGSLNLIPFGALLDGNGKFLIETHDFSYLSSGRDLLRPATTSKPGPALLVAAPDYDAKATTAGAAAAVRSEAFQPMKFTALPGTLAEVKSLTALLPGARAMVGTNATEAAIKAEKSPLLLHIATHGFFLSDEPSFAGARGLKRVKQEPAKSETAPAGRLSFFAMESPLVRSGLALAGANHLESGSEDGILTALEATGLDLRGTKLVVLSACETGIGEVISGEGVYGLRRAFHLAGAESQVLSLWKVHDEATRDLMERYYTRLTKGGARAASLREAQLALLAGKNYRHPAFWAPFILSGESGPL